MGNSALNCCSTSRGATSNASDAIIFLAFHAQAEASYVSLQAGYYYPIKLVYINVSETGVLKFQIQTPSGITI